MGKNVGVLLLSVFATLCVLYPHLVNSHGRLLDPPNRSSLWRFPEFNSFKPPHNYEDNQLFCGGVAVQHEQNNGKCGECGDAWNLPRPRANENGGTFGRSIIARNYTSGQWIDIHIELSASHWGHFEIRLCPLTSGSAIEENSCFDSNLLDLDNGSKEFHIVVEQEQEYFFKAKLPEGLTCDRCVVQWHYLTGNSWGLCPNGTQLIGCGPQETFRGCADVAIF